MTHAVLLVNLGTPDAPAPLAVRRYLTQFLNDPYVIDIPQPWRFLLVNFIIIPFRVKKSTGLYRRLWTPDGSPILTHLLQLSEKLERLLPGQRVYAAMRYGNPALGDVLRQLHADGVTHLTVLPLYPQFADSTTETIFEVVRRSRTQLPGISEVKFIRQFYNHPAFIDSFAERIASYRPHTFDHVIFSYHSLPERHLNRIHPATSCNHCSCSHAMPSFGGECYKATAYETARLLAARTGIAETNYSVAFQSRFAKKWVGPFTEDKLKELARSGTRRVLVVAPSFVADCLETIVEISYDYRDLFLREGGEELVMVESLNSGSFWAKNLAQQLLSS